MSFWPADLQKHPSGLPEIFNYLGVVFQPNVDPTKHLKRLRSNALVGTKTRSVKIDLVKVQMNTARKLFETIILPSATFCLETFREKLTESVMQRHFKILNSICYKRWAGVRKRLSTEQLMTRMFEDDFLRLSVSYKSNRKISMFTIAMDVIN